MKISKLELVRVDETGTYIKFVAKDAETSLNATLHTTNVQLASLFGQWYTYLTRAEQENLIDMMRQLQ